jgi:arabinofuranosyltransferase
MSGRPGLERALVLLVVVAFLCHAALFLGGIIDDAYISFRYARNLVDGLGLVFNEGERVEGYTNFSWVMLSAASLALGLSPSVTTPLVGALSGALLVWIAAREGRRLASDEAEPVAGAGLSGALLIAGSPGLALYAVSGLEETLFALLTTCASIALVARRRAQFAVYTSFAFLTRPEAGLLGVMGALFFLHDLRRTSGRLWLRSLLAPAAIFLLMVGPYLAFKHGYYGSIIPNTFHAKEPNLAEALTYTVDNVWPWLGLALLTVVAAWRRTLSAARMELGLLWAAFVLSSVLVGPDWMPAGRFLLPAVPLLALAADGVVIRALHGLRSPGTRGAGLVALAALLLVIVPSLRETGELSPLAPGWEHRNDVGRQLARQFSAEGVESIATVSLGMLAYEAPRIRFLDLAGLVDAEIARGPGGHLQKTPSDAYMIAQNPELYLLTSPKPIFDATGQPRYFAELDIEEYVFKRPWFHQRYAYQGSLQVFSTHFYHFFRRRQDAR